MRTEAAFDFFADGFADNVAKADVTPVSELLSWNAKLSREN